MRLSHEQKKAIKLYLTAKRFLERAKIKLAAMGVTEDGQAYIEHKDPIDPDWIIDLVNNKFKTDISRKTRQRGVAYPRHIARYLLRHYTSLSMVDIGQITTGADHTTVCHSVENVKNWFETGDDWANHVRELEQIIGNTN